MDNTVRVAGYHADLGRYAFFAQPSDRQNRAFAKVLARADEVAAFIKPDVPIDKIHRSIPEGLPFEVHRIAPLVSVRHIPGPDR